MQEKVTKNTFLYPKGYEPDCIIPSEYCSFRFALGKQGQNPLVAICMNPFAARETLSDRTINRIINVSKELCMDGWMVFNLYPERATDATKMDVFQQELMDRNIQEIEKYLVENNIKEVWGAWGNDSNIDMLIKGKEQVKDMLSSIGVKVYYFGTLTKEGNPRHPIQRQEKWDLSKKEYLEL